MRGFYAGAAAAPGKSAAGGIEWPGRVFKLEMLRRIRKSRAVHVALALSAILTIGASLGLHPEPAGALGAPTADGISAFSGPASAHGCFACLVHGAAVAWSTAALPSAGAAEGVLVLPSSTDPAGRLAGRELSGRSPPARA